MTEKLRLVVVVLRSEVEQVPLTPSEALHPEHFLQQLLGLISFAWVHPHVVVAEEHVDFDLVIVY